MKIWQKRNSHDCILFGRTVRRMLTGCAALAALACTDDGLDNEGYDPNRPMAFDVAAPEAWVDGSTGHSAATAGIAVDEFVRSDRGEPLYLVTEESEPAAEAPCGAETRGVAIGSTSDFHTSFGLSAICYTGTFPAEGAEGDLTSNFAHDLKMTRGSASDSWSAADGTQLFRPGSGRLRFYAYAPHSTDERLSAGALRQEPQSAGGLPRIVYTVPAKSEDQLDIMTAMTDCAGGGSGDVSFAFGHALTAVVVKTGAAMLGGDVTKVEFSGVYGSGTHVIGSNSWTPSGSVRTFTVENKVELPDQSDDNAYTEPGTALVDGKLTLMMIPQTLPDGASLKVYFRDRLSGTDRTLTASLKGKVWPVGRRVSYSISSTGVVIDPVAKVTTAEQEVHPCGLLMNVQLEAYARVAQVGQTGNPAVRLPYIVEYSTDGTVWTKGAWLPDEAPSEDDAPTKAISGRLQLESQSSFAAQRASFERKNLITETGLGTAADPYDLSRGGETANCYVVNDHGYYSLPTIYGNARGPVGAAAYTYMAVSAPDDVKDYVLTRFVGHDNLPIAGPDIPGVEDAVLVWQDAPRLVTDVKYENGMVRFRVAKETLTQGNAVVAVRAANGDILWSWHIWVTPFKWDGSEDLTATTAKAIDGPTTTVFSPCNLGYCEPRKGNPARTFRVRFTFTIPDGKGTKKSVMLTQTFPQSAIEASVAGDNTYYQWGRKDPMLPGIFNADILAWAAGHGCIVDQYNMKNKKYYLDHEEYAILPRDNTDATGTPIGASIGQTILFPYIFFKHDRTIKSLPASDPQTYFRTHWHSGLNTPYGLKTIMNFWSSQCDWVSTSSTFAAPNGAAVTKSIYDPCPVGYHVPSPNSFAALSKRAGTANMDENAYGLEDIFDDETGIRIGWKLSLNETDGGTKIFFPATGLRDMGRTDTTTADKVDIPEEFEGTTWPAHADLTFVATTGFCPISGSFQSMLFFLDRRTNQNRIVLNGATNNAYGFTVRPVRD